MKVNVVGYGTVGRAEASLFEKLGHEVSVFDPYVFPEVKRPQNHVDLTFICTPGDVVPEVVNSLVKQGVEGLFVIKSTVPVGTAKRLMEKHGIHLLSNPEFLREQTAFEDVLKPDRIIIGQCCSEHSKTLASIYEPLKRPIYITDTSTSETVKLLSNSYLSMLITFWNESDELIKKLKLNSSEVAQLVYADNRISKYGTAKFGQPYMGKCLPMCMDELISTFHQQELNPILFEAIKKYNLRIQQE